MLSKCLCACMMISLQLFMSFAAHALTNSEADEPRQEGGRIHVNSVITWWSHDATGYHPAMGLVLENASGKDLSGTLIRFQGRFLDLRNGYTQVAREEFDQDFRRNQQRFIKLRGPVPYELPIDKDSWPRIECKVMCRVGSVDDEGTQDLVVSRIDRITMTDEEAMERLRQDLGKRISRPATEAARRKREHHPAEPVKPLVATAAGSLTSNTAKPVRSQGLAKILSLASPPSLGEDFYQFEQAFKRPVETDARDGQWTWARFCPDDRTDIIVGSKGRTGKADIVIAIVPVPEVQQESQVVALAQLLARGKKIEKLKGPQYSVRYMPQGRVQVGTFAATGIRGLLFHPRGSSGDGNNYVIELTRLPDDLDNVLAKESKRVNMLRFYQPMAGIDVDN